MLEGLAQDFQLTLPYILRRAEQLYGYREIVTRRPDKSFHRHTFADFASRSKKLAVALGELGLESGDRVGTLGWNTYQHLEAYFGVPSSGLVLHTLNPRLHEDDLAYIANHAGDKVMLVDETLVPVFEKFREKTDIEHAVVVTEGGDVPEGMISYEDLLSGADEADFEYPDFDEKQAAALCYTSGTTGRPKGALYSHRSTVLHSMMAAMGNTFALSEGDCVLPVVPMFHVNAWGLPFASVLVGAKLMMPGRTSTRRASSRSWKRKRLRSPLASPRSSSPCCRRSTRSRRGTICPALRAMVIGGSAVPKGVIRAYKERHGINVVHAWGMTEMSPIGTVANLTTEMKKLPEEEQLEYKAKQGYPVPFVEIRARGDEGFVPWDGESLGELEVRGPWVARSYYEAPEGDDKFTDDGWFKTGDIVTIDRFGFIKITDRSKDLIKSGGEWISSVELENALMAHPAVSQAAVIAIPHEKWDERPLAAIVLVEGESVTEDDLQAHLEVDFAKFWLPDAYEFVEAIPMTATGKFQKLKLREQFEGYTFKS